jgi:hypothetical protein
MANKTCPVCKKDLKDNKYRPFCSKRCADIDLGRWFNGNYAIPALEEPEDLPDNEEIE